jgi:hypothetical protein
VVTGETKKEVLDAWEREEQEKLVISPRQQEDSIDVNSSDGNSPAAQEVANTGFITTTLAHDNYLIKVVGLQDISFIGRQYYGEGETPHSFTIRRRNSTPNNTTLAYVKTESQSIRKNIELSLCLTK